MVSSTWKSERRLSPAYSPEMGVLSWDVIPIAYRQRFRVTVLSLNSPNPQCVLLLLPHFGIMRIEDGGWRGGRLEVWFEQAGDSVLVECEDTAGIVSVDTGREITKQSVDGTVHVKDLAGGGYDGMLCDDYGSRRVYHSNDGWKDEGFEKFVFEVELLPTDPEDWVEPVRAKRVAGALDHPLDVGKNRPVEGDDVIRVIQDRRTGSTGDCYFLRNDFGEKAIGLNGQKDAKDIIEELGMKEFVRIDFPELVDWFRRSAVTSLHALKDSNGVLVKFEFNEPYRGLKDSLEDGIQLIGISLHQAREMFGMTERRGLFRRLGRFS